jgi:hypothetical protein
MGNWWVEIGPEGPDLTNYNLTGFHKTLEVSADWKIKIYGRRGELTISKP